MLLITGDHHHYILLINLMLDPCDARANRRQFLLFNIVLHAKAKNKIKIKILTEMKMIPLKQDLRLEN